MGNLALPTRPEIPLPESPKPDFGAENGLPIWTGAVFGVEILLPFRFGGVFWPEISLSF